jgi:parvulin-like peptidyl-prolyl isomerase|tara:strand:- start:202 stop:1317 length:1116 start_codon:yes stop_codon:yes gene_type:complete
MQQHNQIPRNKCNSVGEAYLGPRKGATTLLSLLLAVFVVALPNADVIEAVLVKVNGEIIAKTEFEERQIQLLRELRMSGELGDTSDEALSDALYEATPELIVTAIDELLLVQKAKEMNLTMEEGQFTDIVNNIKEQNNFETDEQFEAALSAEDMTMDDLRRSMERQVMISRVRQVAIMSKVRLTEFEIREYYENHLDDYGIPRRVTLREILIESLEGNTNLETDRILMEKAEAARQRILKGESFASVAAEISDSQSRSKGGLIGPIDENDLAPAIQDLLINMEPSDMSQPFKTTLGYQILQLDTLTEAGFVPFEEVKDEIQNRIFIERRDAEFESYMGTLREEAIIEWKNEALREAYDERIAQNLADKSDM